MAKYLYLRLKQAIEPGKYNPAIHEPANWEYIVAEDLGSGSGGVGNKYLADDMTWKSVSSGGLTDGTMGDIVVSGTGTILTIDTGAIDDSKIATGITASKITEDATHRFATDAEKTAWNAKQAALVSATNIKTINGNTLLGAGDIVISSGLTQQQIEGLI